MPTAARVPGLLPRGVRRSLLLFVEPLARVQRLVRPRVAVQIHPNTSAPLFQWKPVSRVPGISELLRRGVLPAAASPFPAAAVAPSASAFPAAAFAPAHRPAVPRVHLA